MLLPDDRLVAFGSGASAAREKIVVASKREPPSVHDTAMLYRSVRAEPAFSGSELNVEGAVVLGERLLLFQRGNGGTGGERKPVNALGALDLESFIRWLDGLGPAPPSSAVTPFDLGEIGGSALGFTDAAVTADGSSFRVSARSPWIATLTAGLILAYAFAYANKPGSPNAGY